MTKRLMAPISPGMMSDRPRKPIKPTSTTKAYRFEGFSKRIAKIKIDPVHTVQSSRLSEDHNDLLSSFFRSALDEWAELNLSATFTSFLTKVQPVSESLPQILHHADKIFSLLSEHIEKQDVLALEPLLSLIGHLAHDLGSTFEKYFTATVKLVTQVSASVDDPAAIEYCFTCLAWIFKYLSRVLVKDLRPLLEIMVSYFSSKKEYVRRFSAESLSFLLRKAAVMYKKTQIPLNNAITSLFGQLEGRDGLELESMTKTLMTLLSETAVGVDARLHSSAVDLFDCVFVVVGDNDSNTALYLPVLDGTMINIIHRTDAAGFQPLLQLITTLSSQRGHSSTSHDSMVIGLLLVITATRKGSRISHWKPVIELLLHHLQCQVDAQFRCTKLTNTLLTASATVIQYCPMDQLLPFADRIMNSALSISSPSQYLAFCEIVSDLGRQRFQDLLLPKLQKYIMLHWSSEENGICYLLFRLRGNNTISPNSGEAGYMMCHKDWENHVLQQLSGVSSSTGFPSEYSKYFRLHKVVHFPKDSSVQQSLQAVLRSSLDSALAQQHVKFDLSIRLSMGWGFELYQFLTQKSDQNKRTSIAPQILKCRPEYYQLLPFVESCVTVLEQDATYQAAVNSHENAAIALCENMLCESVSLREKSLEMLQILGRTHSDGRLVETCDLLLELIKTPYLPTNARQISMLVRRLPKGHENCVQSVVLRKLVPMFALGLMRHYHDQTRKDLCSAIGQMVLSGSAEDVVLDVVTQWLQRTGALEQVKDAQADSDRPIRLTPFQCSNLQALQIFSGHAFDAHPNAERHLNDDFEQAHLLRPVTTPCESRILALQILLEIPKIAEQRSRALSPVFLSVQQSMAHHHVPHSDESASSHTLSPDFSDQPWSLQERKLFLELLGKFVNPRVLYRSREVYECLLELLTNGNADIRRLALIALLNWKDPSVPQYREVLLRVAEEKNATTELALLLSSDEDASSIQSYDRQSVLPILLRLVFGQLVGRTGTHGSQEAKRKSILRLLFRMQDQEIVLFLKIALGRLGEVSFQDSANSLVTILDHDIVSQDRQYGFLRLMLSVQDVLQNGYAPYGREVVDAVVYCTARACYQMNRSPTGDTTSNSAPALVRSIRRSGIQCLTKIFEDCNEIIWDQYLPVIFDEIVNPRVANLAIELAQGIAGLLRLFSVWSKSHGLVNLLKRNDVLSESLWSLLGSPATRDDVKTFVLEHIVASMLELSSATELDINPAAEILKSDIDSILQSLVKIFERQPSKDLLLAATKTIPSLAPFASSSNATNEVVNLLINLLCEPAQRIPPHVKGSLLSAMASLLRLKEVEVISATRERLYEVIAGLYNYFKDQPNRMVLGELLSVLAGNDVTLLNTVQICQDLNAVSSKHLGEIDYERQLGAYLAIGEKPIAEASAQQWLPILNNLIYFARTADDFAIRSNAVNCLKRYIVEACRSSDSEALACIRNPLIPALKKGIRESSELVRADFVFMYGLIVKSLPNAPDLADMKVLLVGDDEEASFFTNILHVQQHRRLRALRRLLTEVERGAITSSNVTDFFIPLLEKFIDDESPDESVQGVKGQSIAAMAILLQWVDWKSFRTQFRQYKNNLNTAIGSERDIIKLLSNAADALTSVCRQLPSDDVNSNVTQHLKATLPPSQIISTELRSNFIPKLSNFIHHKDEAEISLRIPAAKVAVKLINLLPADEVQSYVAPIILDVSQILRSRTQESRDIARNTLAEIVQLLGPPCVQFVLNGMRNSLTRGYQLHVLSYTMHTILLQSAEFRKPGDLDYCVDELISVIMDDIFGIVGQEKENQDYISTMKEVKSSKSQDSMELIAQSTGLKNLSRLILPFQALLAGHLTTRQVRHVDELLRRIGVGISHNPDANSRGLLVFAYELIQSFYRQKVNIQNRVITNNERNKQRFLVQIKSAAETTTSLSSSLQYKIVRFSLDVVRSTLSKNASLLTSENVHGFLPIIGDALVEAQEDVRISALRLLATIIKLPLAELDKNAAMYVMEAVKVVRGAINTNEESSQAALKLVATLLRERKHIQIRDSDIAYLLHRTMPDIEEPDRQGVTFNFIKSVMAKKYQLPEVYELMDKIGIMMVTNQNRSGRDVARGVFVHFLLEYPQSKNRWTKQLRFLLKNLEYEFREGRQSVMEAVYVLVQKLSGEMLEEVISTFFIPTVLRMANDDDSSCREMSGALLAQIFRTSTESKVKALLELLRVWLEQVDNLSLTKVSMQAWGVYFDSGLDAADAEIPNIRKFILRALQDADKNDSDWEVQYQALELCLKLARTHPAAVISQGQTHTWTLIRRLLNSHHAQIQVSAANLINVFLEDCVVSGNSLTLPLTGQYGLRFDREAILELLQNSVKVMKRNESNASLAQTTLQNLLFLGKFIATVELTYEVQTVVNTTGDNNRLDGKHELNSDSTSEKDSEIDDMKVKAIPAIQYLLDQLTTILRREPNKLTTAAFMPRISALTLLNNLIPQLSLKPLSDSTLGSLLIPLTHITDPSLQSPRSADPTFAATYQSYIDLAHELQQTVQRKVGDAMYIKLMTNVSKIVRERRDERRMKRVVEQVAEPEKAEREKKRKKEMKARRKKSVVDIHRKKRRGDLGF